MASQRKSYNSFWRKYWYWILTNNFIKLNQVLQQANLRNTDLKLLHLETAEPNLITLLSELDSHLIKFSSNWVNFGAKELEGARKPNLIKLNKNRINNWMSVQVNHLKYFDENSRKQKKIFQLLIIRNVVLMKLSMTWNFWINKPTFSEEFRNEIVSKITK